MQAATFDGTTLGIVGGIVIIILAALVVRVVRGDRSFRYVRFGVFLERDRFEPDPPPEGDDDQPD